MILFFGPYATRQEKQDVTQIGPEFYDASFCILFCLRDRKREIKSEKQKINKKKVDYLSFMRLILISIFGKTSFKSNNIREANTKHTNITHMISKTLNNIKEQNT